MHIQESQKDYYGLEAKAERWLTDVYGIIKYKRKLIFVWKEN